VSAAQPCKIINSMAIADGERGVSRAERGRGTGTLKAYEDRGKLAYGTCSVGKVDKYDAV
jgi:hypothetical protein